jgi:hypothetical protein
MLFSLFGLFGLLGAEHSSVSPHGSLGSAVMCARCNGGVTLTGVTFQSNTPSAPAPKQQVPVVWVGYTPSVTITDCEFNGNTGASIYLSNIQSIMIGASQFVHNSLGYVSSSASFLAFELCAD